MPNPRTIEIFLPDGEPKGLKVAHIRTRNLQATFIPRAELNESKVKGRESLHGVGIYILVGDADDHIKPKVYIGEAEVVFTRLIQHNGSKDFWTHAIAITSNSKHFTKTHVKFLEWLCHSKAAAANRCVLENGNIPSRPYVPESTEADLYEDFETLDLLVSTLSLAIFQPLTKTAITSNVPLPKSDSNEEIAIFSISGRGAQANGIYIQEGFLVFSGAVLAQELSPSLARSNAPNTREQMTKDGIIGEKDGKLLLLEDHLFSSPSAAATIIVGTSLNGWICWKLPGGRTLDDIYRKGAAA